MPRVGIIGAGQLGRMMALAAYPLGVECRFLDTHARAPGGQLAPIHVAALDDQKAMQQLASEVDVMTFDIENVSVPMLRSLTSSVPVMPSPDLVAKAQDRLHEKQLFASLGIPAAPHVALDTPQDIDQIEDSLGWPVILKARRLGYDGRGQRVVASREELLEAWEALGSTPAIAEGFIDFDCEVSLIGARGAEDQIVFYPLSRNHHSDGMLESSIAPYPDDALEQQAQSWMSEMMRQFDYRGVLTIEFFVTADGLIANEIAPRVHNSGHWTIEGAETSQFENHIRAVLGLPLGSTRTRGVSVMRNLIGSVPPASDLLAIDGLHLHDYGKESRPGRKVGHCTMLAPDLNGAQECLKTINEAIAAAGT